MSVARVVRALRRLGHNVCWSVAGTGWSSGSDVVRDGRSALRPCGGTSRWRPTSTRRSSARRSSHRRPSWATDVRENTSRNPRRASDFESGRSAPCCMSTNVRPRLRMRTAAAPSAQIKRPAIGGPWNWRGGGLWSPAGKTAALRDWFGPCFPFGLVLRTIPLSFLAS